MGIGIRFSCAPLSSLNLSLCNGQSLLGMGVQFSLGISAACTFTSTNTHDSSISPNITILLPLTFGYRVSKFNDNFIMVQGGCPVINFVILFHFMLISRSSLRCMTMLLVVPAGSSVGTEMSFFLAPEAVFPYAGHLQGGWLVP